jgi:hypothetical protein
MIKTSKAGKMPCESWSLLAKRHCPGSIGPDGELVAACEGCYADDGNYKFKNVRAVREHNAVDWKRPEWVAEMAQHLNLTARYFRWFDSGDMYALKLAEKIYQVMASTPNTMHWLPTRQHKFKKFAPILAKMEALPNVCVRRSSDSVTGGIIPGKNTSTIVPDPDSVTDEMTLCEAYSRAGKCDSCRACWDKSVQVIAYPAHGRKMAKVIKLHLEAA